MQCPLDVQWLVHKDVQWLVHNFVHVHFTPKVVPAVKLGILEIRISWLQLFTIRNAL
jgi:hypothetical protein